MRLLLCVVLCAIATAVAAQRAEMFEELSPDHMIHSVHTAMDRRALVPVSNVYESKNVWVRLPSVMLRPASWVPALVTPVSAQNAAICRTSQTTFLKSISLSSYSSKDSLMIRPNAVSTECVTRLNENIASGAIGLSPAALMNRIFEIYIPSVPPAPVEEDQQPPVYRFLFHWTNSSAPCAFNASPLFNLQ